MNEVTLQWVQFFKLLVIMGYATLYGFGGMKGKWKRRYVGPAVLVAGIVGLSVWAGSFSWWFVGYLPLLIASLHFGYGGDDFKTKMRKRAIYGSALGCSAITMAIGSGAWALFALHVGLCAVVCISFGVFNITTSARTEETFLAALTSIIPLAMI